MRTGGPNGRRPRSRHHNGGDRDRGNHGGGHNNPGNSAPHNPGGNRPRSAASLRHQSFDSNCGDLRVRGNAWQVHEKYQALARDASSGGDRVLAENYLQHAEHYFRIIEAINEATEAEQRPRDGANPQQPAFNQQPEIPTHYYNADAALSQPVPQAPPSGGMPNGNIAQPQLPQEDPASQVEATVQHRNPPQQSASPFFTQEEIDEHHADRSFTAAR